MVHCCILAFLRLIVEQIDGKYITWKQLWDLYDNLRELQAGSCGLSLVPKLKREHLQLTSYSRMRVDLAAQVTCCNKLCTVLIIYIFFSKVLSKSVCDALAYYNNPDTEQTQKFILMTDRFFDCLNVRNRSEWAFRKKK